MNNLLIPVIVAAVSIITLALSFFQYRKIKGLADHSKSEAVESKKLFDEEKAISDTNKSFLDKFVLATEGLDKWEEAQAHALEIVNQATKKSEQILSDAAKIEDDARKQALATIDEAQAHAQAVIADTQAFKEAINNRLEDAYDKVLLDSRDVIIQNNDILLEHFKAALEDQKQKYINSLQSSTGNVEQDVHQVIDTFLKDMKQRAIDASNQQQAYIQQELSSLKSELDTYKKEQLNKIESNIYEILARASEAVLGQAVNLDLHQELIIKALEQAKREGVFI